MRLSVLSVLFILVSQASMAADICEATALCDVPALESPDSILETGDVDTAITQYRVNSRTGVTSFCSHGGYCYPTHVVVKGKRVEALRLTNCAVVKSNPYVDGEETTYSVEVLRSKVSAEALRRDDLENRLLELGSCSACASSIAELYILKPNSRCGNLTRRALEGDPVAAKALNAFPSYCQAY